MGYGGGLNNERGHTDCEHLSLSRRNNCSFFLSRSMAASHMSLLLWLSPARRLALMVCMEERNRCSLGGSGGASCGENVVQIVSSEDYQEKRQTRVSTIEGGLCETYIWLRWLYRFRRFCTWKKVWIAAPWGQGIPAWPSLCLRRWCGSCSNRLSWLGARTFWFLLFLFINNYNFIFIKQACEKEKNPYN